MKTLPSLIEWLPYSIRVVRLAAVALVALAVQPAFAAESLPATGYVSTYAGAQLDGRQCVPAARDVIFNSTGQRLPYLGAEGVAADLWHTSAPGFTKVSRGSSVPPKFSALVWDYSLGGAGHVAVVLGSPRSGVVRVVDSNWCANNCEFGRIRDVSLSESQILGWLVPEPSAPVLITPSNGTIVYGSTVRMDWSTAAAAGGYHVLVFQWTGTSWRYYGGLATVNSYANVGGMSRGRVYAWVVVAVNEAGSAASSIGYFGLL